MCNKPEEMDSFFIAKTNYLITAKEEYVYFNSQFLGFSAQADWLEAVGHESSGVSQRRNSP